MQPAVKSPYLVPFNGAFEIDEWPTRPPPDSRGKKGQKKRLATSHKKLRDLQRILYAHDRHAVLLIFQAMDAAGKDSTIRAVMTGVNPAGCEVYSFKQPSAEELDHDFLWRTAKRLPQRGRIGIFNRSYYEEVLIVRVHPAILENQRLPGPNPDLDALFEQRLESIREHERHLARNGTVILKFWLNVSKKEQARRFLKRIDEPSKNWKFSPADIKERSHWGDYMAAYQAALRATSRPWAPWYAIPADDKPFMRASVADIVVRTLEGLGLEYPTVTDEERSRFAEMRQLLVEEERSPSAGRKPA